MQVTRNNPFVVQAVLMDIWKDLPDVLRQRVVSQTLVYAGENREQYLTLKLWRLFIKLKPRKNYPSIVRFVTEFGTVVALTIGQILGHMTFGAEALRKSEIFSSNSDMNRFLYPNSSIEPLDTVRLRDLLRALFMGLAENRIDQRVLPNAGTIAEIGDYARNAVRMRTVIAE